MPFTRPELSLTSHFLFSSPHVQSCTHTTKPRIFPQHGLAGTGRLLALALCLAPGIQAHAATATFSGVLTGHGPVFDQPLPFTQGAACKLSSLGLRAPYASYRFTLASASKVTFSVAPQEGGWLIPSDADSLLILYGMAGFNPATACAHAIAANDNADPSTRASRLVRDTLPAGDYTVVLSGYRKTDLLLADTVWRYRIVVTGSGVVATTNPAIAAGDSHSLALKSDGTLLGWGSNGDYELGDTTTESPVKRAPEPIPNLKNIVGIAAGYKRSFAVQADGTVVSFGNNIFGELGRTVALRNPKPAPIPKLTNVAVVSAGMRFSAALKDDGSVWTWGDDSYGELGSSEPCQVFPCVRGTPAPVAHLDNIVDISAGGYHALALKSDGSVWAWGDNGYGQLGNDAGSGGLCLGSPCGQQPIQVGVGYTQVAAGFYHSLGLKADGTVWAWGDNNLGQLGTGQTDPTCGIGNGQPASKSCMSALPTQIPHLSNVVAIAAGRWHNLAIKADGTVWAWGVNNQNELGGASCTPYPCASFIPAQIAGLNQVVTLAAGGGYSYRGHTLAMRADSTVTAFGTNHAGQLGLGDNTERTFR